MKSVSIKDIARAAGVSHPTVSRALRDSPLVSRKTAEHIRQIATGMGYYPNAVARGLVTKRTRTIGVVVTTIADPFIGEIVIGIEEMANDNGYSVFLANSQADPVREIRVVRSFQQRRVDGILVAASRVGALYVPLLEQLKVPIVLINNQHPDEFVHSVVIDNVTASFEAVQHLTRQGHRRIGYIGDQFGFQSDTERLGGYRQALAAAGLPFVPELMVHGDGKPEGALRAMEKLLALSDPPTAVFCYNDMSAVGALRAARAHKLRVPEDVSLVGFDDLFIASYLDPPLTTVRQPKERMGRKAMELLLELFSDTPHETKIKMGGELIVRESTAPPKGT
jgi:DNA-binding LacI/PurR family transcriptional regulator